MSHEDMVLVMDREYLQDRFEGVHFVHTHLTNMHIVPLATDRATTT
jgi:hypothetical protein